MPNSTEEGGGSSGNHSGSGSSKREKKKQRRKEEEQRLNEEGAKLAEAVALQVLLDEESEGKDEQDEIYSPESNESVVGDSISQRLFSAQQHRRDVSAPIRRVRVRTPEWGSAMVIGTAAQNEDELASRKGLICSAEEKARASTERARAAEMAAGLAAAQAVAALRIAEEARAEAEAAKKAAEAAMIEALDQREMVVTAQVPEEEDKNELKARLIETERKLMEKTKRVSELEQNLDEVTQYLLEFKAKFESGKEGPNTVRIGGGSEGHVTQQVG